MSIAYAGQPEQIAIMPDQHDLGHNILHWLLTHAPGGVWTVLTCAGLGLLFLVAVTFRKRIGRFVVPILQALLLILSGKDDK